MLQATVFALTAAVLHAGWNLFAKRSGGTLILRLEDTDVARSTLDYERDILDNLHWLGISWDEGPQVAGGDDIGPFAPYRQSQRMDLYAREAGWRSHHV